MVTPTRVEWIPKRTIPTCSLRPFQERIWSVSVRCLRATKVSIKNQRHPKLSKKTYSCAGKEWQFVQIPTQDNLHTSSTNVVWTLWGWVPMCRILREASHHGRVKLCWIRGVIEMKWYAHERAHEMICARVCAWNDMRTSVRKYRKCDKKRKTKNSQRKIRDCRQSWQNWHQFRNPVLGTAQ